MDRYALSQGGRWRFMRIKENTETAKFEGYEILACLYQEESATVEEISYHTELSQSQVVDRLRAFISQGFVEKVAEL